MMNEENSQRHQKPAFHHQHATLNSNPKYLLVALVLLGLFMATEVITAVVSGSLALLSDATHILSDMAAIALALWTIKLAHTPRKGIWTWGLKRAEILSAAVNGAVLLILAIAIGIEAISRLISPPPIVGGLVLLVSLVGIAVNIAVVQLVARANRSSLNIEGAYQHILTDLYGFIGTFVAGVIIIATRWTPADTIASLIICALMIRAGWGLLRDTGRILLEGAPDGLSLSDIRKHLLNIDHVYEVHDLHAWSLSSELPALSVHLVLDPTCFNDGHTTKILDDAQSCLQHHFNIDHTTIQIEPPTHSAHEPTKH